MRLSTLYMIFLCLLFSISSWADEASSSDVKLHVPANSSASQSKATEPSTFDEVFQQELKKDEGEGDSHFWKNFIYMLFVLGLLVSMLLFLSWAMKKMVYTRLLQDNATSMIKILDRRSLSPKSMLYVVEVEGKRLILGESLHGVTKLAEKNLASDFSIVDEETQESLKKLSDKRSG